MLRNLPNESLLTSENELTMDLSAASAVLEESIHHSDSNIIETEQKYQKLVCKKIGAKLGQNM